MIGAWEFVKRHPEVLTDWVVEHLVISLTAIAMGAILGCALGFFITGKGREGLAEGILYIAEIMMTVPSLALFGFAMLLLGHLGLNAIGFLPAVITLVVYGQLPILRNTYTAIREVDPAMMEAGKALGMSQRQLLFKVNLPLALPVIVAGLRNSMVLTIGIATIAALIGAGGLGVPIFRGLRNARMDLVIVGGFFVSVLALLADGFMAALERWITPRGLRG